ncbi:MAG: hypothetical protein ACYTKD_30210 [Planctomycetota bacterium]
MIDVADPPPGSRIRVEREHAAVTLSWRARLWDATPRKRAVYVVTDLITCLLVVAWVVWLAHSLVDLLDPATFSEELLELILVGCVGGVFIWASWDRYRRRARFRATERLVLGEDTLIHTPSARRKVAPYRPPEERSEVARPAGPEAPPPSHTWPRAFVRRPDMGDIRLAGKGASEIIAVASAEGELTMGRRLPHADREWLASVLKRWKESPAWQESSA